MSSSSHSESESIVEDKLSSSILALVAIMDENGAQEWSLRVVALISCLILLAVRQIVGKRGEVCWWSFLHALVSGLGAAACIYLDLNAAEQIRGVPEPYGSIRCEGGGPLTSLHRVLPAITAGYAVFDLLESFHYSWDFLIHGGATFALTAVFVESPIPHLITPMLVMELSTIFLLLIQANFLSTALSVVNQILFLIVFFLVRVLLCPYMWGVFMRQLILDRLSSSPSSICLPFYLFPLCLVFGILFHSLNLYWFYKIVRKAKRKLLKQEAIDHNNDMSNFDQDGTKEKET